MKIKWTMLLVIAALLLFPVNARADSLRDDKYVFGGTYMLAEGETLDGNLYVFGGLATLEVDSHVEGDIVLAGGTLRVAGVVDGDISATAGLVTLESTAVVGKDVNITAANLERDPGAVVRGKVAQAETIPFQFGTPPEPGQPTVQVRTNPFWRASWLLFRSFVWAVLAILAVMFLPRQTERTADAALAQPVIATGLGLVTAIVVPLFLVLTAITIIGIPVTLVGALALLAAWAFGVISLGTEVGRRVAALFKQEWALAVSAGIGAFILTLLMNLLGNIWCVGWMIPALIGMIGLGAVLLTRFGTRSYMPVVPYNSPVQMGAPDPAIEPVAYQPPSPPPAGDEDR